MNPIKKKTARVYMDSYILQKDMRVRMPKEIIKNLGISPGHTFFDVFLDIEQMEIVLTPVTSDSEEP